MLKDELDKLVLLAGEMHSEQKKKYQEDQCIRECSRIKKAWTDLLFSQPRDDLVRRYVRYHQQKLLDLADDIYGAAAGKELLLTQALLLIDFLNQYFNAFTDQDMKIPRAALAGIAEQLAADAERTMSYLEKQALDPGLKKILLEYSSLYQTLFTYRSVACFRAFADTLASTEAAEITDALLYLNFNQRNFYHWYQGHILDRQATLKPAERSIFLKRTLLNLKTIPVLGSTTFDPGLPPVNVQLAIWLESYIQNELQTDQPAKLELKLTVAQLSLLLRLLYEEGIFAGKNIAGVLRFFAGRFMSKKQEHISYGSMNKLYYAADQFTAYAVRELLLKMIAKINKMFFPK